MMAMMIRSLTLKHINGQYLKTTPRRSSLT